MALERGSQAAERRTGALIAQARDEVPHERLVLDLMTAAVRVDLDALLPARTEVVERDQPVTEVTADLAVRALQVHGAGVVGTERGDRQRRGHLLLELERDHLVVRDVVITAVDAAAVRTALKCLAQACGGRLWADDVERPAVLTVEAVQVEADRGVGAAAFHLTASQAACG